MATANTRMTVGALLGTIKVAAGSVTESINEASKTIDHWAQKNKIRREFDKEGFLKHMRETSAQERVEAQLSIESFCSQSARHQELYQKAYDDLQSVVDRLNNA